jgi:hypothetical protein
MSFEPNVGQAAAPAQYVSHGGGLKDGGSGSLWYRPARTRKFEPGSTSGLLEAVFDDEDATQAIFWTEFSGDPFNPHAGSPSRLVRTEGAFSNLSCRCERIGPCRRDAGGVRLGHKVVRGEDSSQLGA